MAGRLSTRVHPRRIRRILGAASCVEEPLRFVVAELRDRPTTAEYRLRRSSHVGVVRHPLLDMWVLEELFRFGVYEPPAPVAQTLAALDRPVRILDLGGHVGLFGLFMLDRLPDASIVSFEPDPSNVEVLRRCVSANRLERRWQIVEACAALRDGTVSFASSFHLSRIAEPSDRSLEQFQRQIGGVFPFLAGTPLLSPERRQLACRDVLPVMAEADLVKIDIEGAEWELLADPRLREIGTAALVLEYHPAYLIDTGFEADVVVQERLMEAGYRTTALRRGGDAGTIWAWRDGERTS